MVPSSRKDADSGRIAVKFSRANSINNSIFGDWCSPETWESRRIGKAERDNQSGISSVEARPQFLCSTVLHTDDYEFADMELKKQRR
ncbi:hypothetical protein H5410_038394 [Solanum commersonii]|uniref:Uncharacterized protein n=1 Tax=Solanum commersonii TaxID=4109 RepID=A0A9J5YAJ6_SOLCO|nr:hypothetical protein H5410_038394 [Solanum commersonii]